MDKEYKIYVKRLVVQKASSIEQAIERAKKKGTTQGFEKIIDWERVN